MTSILLTDDNNDVSFDANITDQKSVLRKLIDQGKDRGFISMEELKKNLPSESQNAETFEVIMASLADMGINVIDGSEDITDLTEEAHKKSVASTIESVAEETGARINDPVRLYLREMGAVELLSREGEIAIRNNLRC